MVAVAIVLSPGIFSYLTTNHGKFIVICSQFLTYNDAFALVSRGYLVALHRFKNLMRPPLINQGKHVVYMLGRDGLVCTEGRLFMAFVLISAVQKTAKIPLPTA